jgi:large subunit ribosomal protein L53
MISRFITEVNTKFNPFSTRSKAARLFLAFLPPNARSQGMTISTTLLPRTSAEPSKLYIKFSMSHHFLCFTFKL